MRLNVVPLPQTRHPLKGRLPARDEDDVGDVGDVDDVGDIDDVGDVDDVGDIDDVGDVDDFGDVGEVDVFFLRPTFPMPIQRLSLEINLFDTNTETLKNGRNLETKMSHSDDDVAAATDDDDNDSLPAGRKPHGLLRDARRPACQSVNRRLAKNLLERFPHGTNLALLVAGHHHLDVPPGLDELLHLRVERGDHVL